MREVSYLDLADLHGADANYLYKHSPKTLQQLKELAESYSRLQHMRCVMACARLCTCLKHWRHAKKSTPCLIKKASRCAAYSTSKTAKFIIFPFLSNTKRKSCVFVCYFIGSVVKIVSEAVTRGVLSKKVFSKIL